ncbi:MAG TPA: homogentisate 1,2-dioxygenase [Hyphomicrobiales bacterium]|nr:homogentisate 1,2-dioxygenase [Rhodobiaceae bacterium]HXK53144.1 homogentisate 1,2-dioxygenase [Hyphomicrobiales bacterium]
MALSKYIQVRRVEGQSSRQAHCDLPEGTFERELGKEGFFGPAAMMYHAHPPTGWTSWDGPLRPRAFDLVKLEQTPSFWDAPMVLYNASVRMRQWRFEGKMDHLVRNGDGDELLFVHGGSGSLFCDYGHMPFTAGDYIVLPRATMWRMETSAPVTLLAIENTNGTYMLPERGIVGKHAIFDEAILDTPQIDDAFRAQQDEKEWHVHIKRRNAISTVVYPFNPLDAVGWQGDLAPVKLNVRDIRPLMSHRFHLPPSAHSTWVGNRFVICTFVPRPFESDPGALKVPFFHNNDDYDEVIFYHAGDFFSRDNIHPGMMTWHPCGFTHGPHPKALARMFEQAKPATDEYAVMLDTRDGLEMGDGAASVEWTGYSESWKTGEPVKAPSIAKAKAQAAE